jgi:hypothetical protein
MACLESPARLASSAGLTRLRFMMIFSVLSSTFKSSHKTINLSIIVDKMLLLLNKNEYLNLNICFETGAQKLKDATLDKAA